MYNSFSLYHLPSHTLQPQARQMLYMLSFTIETSRYVLGYKGNARQHCVEAKGSRASGGRVIHVVTASTSASQLQSLLNDKLLHLCSADDTEIQVGVLYLNLNKVKEWRRIKCSLLIASKDGVGKVLNL